MGKITLKEDEKLSGLLWINSTGRQSMKEERINEDGGRWAYSLRRGTKVALISDDEQVALYDNKEEAIKQVIISLVVALQVVMKLKRRQKRLILLIVVKRRQKKSRRMQKIQHLLLTLSRNQNLRHLQKKILRMHQNQQKKIQKSKLSLIY